MKKFSPQERRQLKMDGYTEEEILRMEMEAGENMEEDEDKEEEMEEMPTNAGNMRSIPWNDLRGAGQPDMKRASIMGSKKVRK